MTKGVYRFCVFVLACAGMEVTLAWTREPNYDESKVAPYTLEDPLSFADGRKLRGPEEWSARRQEILGIFAREMYGQPPPEPEAIVTEQTEEGVTLGGFAVRRQMRMWFKNDRSGPHVDWLIVFPRYAKKPVPVLMGLNYRGNHEILSDKEIPVPTDAWVKNNSEAFVTDHRPSEKTRGLKCDDNQRSIVPAAMVIARGYALMTACYGQVSPDPYCEEKDPRYFQIPFAFTGVFDLWPKPAPGQEDYTASLGAWAWALSRGLDLAERIPEIDAKRCLATGYSRLAKAALLATARDERFAACVPVQCGAGGVQLLKRDFGENVTIVNEGFRHWMCGAYRKWAGHELEMPFDQHLLVASIAPRPLLVLGFDEPWYDTKGEWLSCKAASPAWEFLGKPGLPDVEFPATYDTSCIGPVLGYARRTEKHGMSPYDWTWLLDFADRNLRESNFRGNSRERNEKER